MRSRLLDSISEWAIVYNYSTVKAVAHRGCTCVLAADGVDSSNNWLLEAV